MGCKLLYYKWLSVLMLLFFLGDVHLKNVWSFSKGLYRENDKLWANRVEPLSEQQGINNNLVVWMDHHLKSFFLPFLQCSIQLLFRTLESNHILWKDNNYSGKFERKKRRSPRLIIRLCNSETLSQSAFICNIFNWGYEGNIVHWPPMPFNKQYMWSFSVTPKFVPISGATLTS